MKKTKILFIKLGYSETLDSEIGRVVSLGDVLRTTPVVEAIKDKYKNSHLTWLVSREAEPLLNNNPYIDRVIVWDEFTPFQLLMEKFDLMINLEKIPGVCAIGDKIEAWNKYGFRFNSDTGNYDGYEQGLEFIDYINQKEINCNRHDYWQKTIIEMLGLKWKEQQYTLGYKPKNKPINEIGLNYKVGNKWPEKAMSEKKWKNLECKLLDLGYSISWQKGLNSLEEYFEWINSCEMIISQDSLGLHLALAMKKKLIGLFGPTPSSEIFFTKESIVIESKTNKMKDIKINDIIDGVQKLFKNK
ncbi:glycosyltransferase family 9 protein [Halarcobacter ebronensis]|uniref:Glycosyl transferase n=1 Tax=Halarcobacter ebronensis TaxID=1462615 RepID=A0A4Q1AVA5_9BACT|nr:glycosyltransferase family 9 protein [Halarcobacter ebronensis]QKF83321.1 glycosyltransferase, family 9 [Halarcobacter ebronensis]RXK05883.1 glycosyl transferase [Halarcobacter ebronensis]